MDETDEFDHGRPADWSKTSVDFAAHRPGPPPSFYRRLEALGVGLAGQRILDLGTGTGLMARQFARQGVTAFGTDIAPGQIEAAVRLADEEGLDVGFQVAPAEASPFPDRSFDAITALQCWSYFDKPRAIADARRLLLPGGLLVTAQFSWVPGLDSVARASEDLVLEFNPQWTGAGWDGVIPAMPEWARAELTLAAMFWYDEAIPFTRESWRGRMRACRGVGAALPPDEVEAYDRAHAELLETMVPAQFTVLHRMDAHLFLPR